MIGRAIFGLGTLWAVYEGLVPSIAVVFAGFDLFAGLVLFLTINSANRNTNNRNTRRKD